MSWENGQCVCGGRKQRETMLCAECERALANRPEMATLKDGKLSKQFRRRAAFELLALARDRKGTQLRFEMEMAS